nr:MFS transporter [Sulfobacillus harzensis]
MAGLAISSLGDQIYLVALNVRVLDASHSSLAVSGLWMVPPLAGLLLGSVSGGLADRWDRRRSLVASNLLSTVTVGLIPLMPNIFLIYAAVFLTSAAGTLFMTALPPYFKLLVPESAWARTTSLRGLFTYGSLVLGPAVAGLLLLHDQTGTAIWIDSASFLASALALIFLPPLNPGGLPEPADWRKDMALVARFLRQHRGILAVIAGFSGIIVFGSAADAQEVVFARQALHLGRSGYSLLVGAAGVGYVVGAALAVLWGKRLSRRLALGVGALLSAACYVLYSRTTTLSEAAATLIGLGIFQSIANAGLSLHLQYALPTAIMGRVMGTVQAAQYGLTVIAVLIGGVTASSLGVRPMMTSAALAALLSGLFLTWQAWRPTAGHLTRQEEPSL